jgi:hypothetical protein
MWGLVGFAVAIALGVALEAVRAVARVRRDGDAVDRAAGDAGRFAHAAASRVTDVDRSGGRRSIIDLMFRTERFEWDGSVPLRDLFDLGNLGAGTAASGDLAPLIDQRFIDYLHAQPEDLSRMHWRQFEFLVGEFFRRNGYDVVITPPSGDGGVDVRAVRSVERSGRNLFLSRPSGSGTTGRLGLRL